MRMLLEFESQAFTAYNITYIMSNIESKKLEFKEVKLFDNNIIIDSKTDDLNVNQD